MWPDMAKLTGRQLDALKEIQRFSVPYYWRRASMRTLAALGLVEAIAVVGRAAENGPWRITDAGRAALSELGH